MNRGLENILKIGQKTKFRDIDPAYHRNCCYRVWPYKNEMPGYFGQRDIIKSSLFQVFDKKEQALKFSEERGGSPVYKLSVKRNFFFGKKNLVVKRIR
ncbi:MAG: hypothetical protein AABX77_00450 [Nanoarchaeota archaeon]